MKKYLILAFLFGFLENSAFAFDRLHCQTDLKGWIVTLSESTQSAVITPYNQNATLPEKISGKLIVKDTDANSVITIFPWNSLYIRIPDNTKKHHIVESKESSEGFFIEILDKTNKTSRTLNCRFTF